MNEQELLKKLQETDLKADKLVERRENLPEKASYDETLSELEATQKELAKKIKESEEEDLRQKKADGELERMTAKIKTEEDRLYGGKVSNPKELMAIQDELKMLRGESDQLETDYLQSLDRLEGLKGEVKSLRETESKLSRETSKLKAAYDQALDEIESELAGLKADREKVVKGIEPDTRKLYERLRREKGGLAVALVKKGVCQGCGVQMSTGDEDLMFKEERIWRCDNCKRILVR